MAITDTLNLTPQQVAEQNPELHEMRQKFFGQDYLSDIEKGDTGTVQYYTGLGDPNFLNYTEEPIEESVEAMAPVETGIVDIGTGGADIPIDPIDTEPVIPPFIETEPNVLIPPTFPGGAPMSGPHGDYVITDPVTGDTYAPGDYTDVAGTLADPREKIDTLADTGGRDLPTIQQYADRSFGVDYDNVDDYEEQAAIDEAYNELYGTEYKQSPDITPLDIITMGAGNILDIPLNLIKTGIESLMPEEETTTYPIITELPTAEDYGDPTIMDAPDITPLEIATGIEAPPSILSRPVQTYSPPAPTYSPPPSPHGGGGNGGSQSSSSGGGGYSRGDYGGRGHHWAEGGLIRKQYSSGGIVDLI